MSARKLQGSAALLIGVILVGLFGCSSQESDGATIETSKTSDDTAKNEVVVALDNADSAMGKRFFIQCQACHTIDDGAGNLVGPNLWGLLGRAAGKQAGFNYSAGLAEADFVWDVATLDQFLTRPNDVIPGTTMAFSGIADAKHRRDLLAYLIQATTRK